MDEAEEAQTSFRLTKAQQGRLIELVKQNPMLYDLTNGSRGNRTLTVQVWQDIAQKLNVDGFDWTKCRAKWKTLRDYHNFTRKKLEDAEKNKPRFEVRKGCFYDEIESILQVVEAGRRGESITIPLQTDESTTNNNDSHQEDNHCHDIKDVIQRKDKKRAFEEETEDETEFSWPQRERHLRPSPSKRSCTNLRPSATSSSRSNSMFFVNRQFRRMESLLEKVAKRFDNHVTEVTDNEKEGFARGKVNSFYAMMSDKMASFPKKHQIWMEGQVWNLYMQLVESQMCSSSPD